MRLDQEFLLSLQAGFDMDTLFNLKCWESIVAKPSAHNQGTVKPTCPAFIPKLLCFFSSASVRACVSSLVMMASGKVRPSAAAPDSFCRAKIASMYNCKKQRPLADSQGNATLMPAYKRQEQAKE